VQTRLSPEFAGTPEGEAAESIVRKCVHCGFCNATCPTYQLLGDELDGPRGRIYQIKQVLEGGAVTRSTQLHLDRCLTCRNCETTCPSGVEYGRLLDLGRTLVDARVERPAGESAVRWLLREGLTSPLFEPALRLGQALRPALPRSIQDKIPARDPGRDGAPVPPTGPRRMILLEGCVQPAMMPNINRATRRVFAAAGIELQAPPAAGCCGSLRLHLSDPAGALADMRRNVDAWWPAVEAGAVEAIVGNASGCSLIAKDYGQALAGDPAYAERAARISDRVRDVTELLPELAAALRGRVDGGGRTLVFHPPCTLQHGQRVRGAVETHLAALGWQVKLAREESHLCCGSAGTYSVLQPGIARQLRDRKLAALTAQEPACIVSANIGCIQHLQSGTATPVRHWIEVLADALG
jgi:glycolate oxidase iron-sulfur subunit